MAVAPSFIAHSLGCRVALETMNGLADGGVSVDQTLLMAGAVDADALARSTRYQRGVRAASRVHVLASRHDRTLRWAFPVGDFVASLLWGGYTQAALGLVGPRPASKPAEALSPNVNAQDISSYSVDHGDYLPSSPPNVLQRGGSAYAAEVLSRVQNTTYRLIGSIYDWMA